MVLASEKAGKDMGLKTEQSQGQWAFLMVSTKGTIKNVPELREYVKHSKGGTADERFENLMKNMVAFERADKGGQG